MLPIADTSFAEATWILVAKSMDTLVSGNVITLEPGVYVEGVGGMRFEHNYLVTGAGFQRLRDCIGDRTRPLPLAQDCHCSAPA